MFQGVWYGTGTRFICGSPEGAQPPVPAVDRDGPAGRATTSEKTYSYSAVAFVAAAPAAGVAAPFQFQLDLDGFCAALLACVAGSAAPPALVVDTAVIACSTVQVMPVTGTFMVLGQSAWAAAVSAHVSAAARAPIVTLQTPRPGATNGACVPVLAAPDGIFV